MKQLLAACLCFGALFVAARADDEKDKKEDKSPKAALQEIMSKAQKEFGAALKAKDEKQQQKVLTETATKLVALAEKNPKDATSLQAVMIIVAGMPLNDNSKDGPKAKALAIIKKDHLDSKEFVSAMPNLAQSDSAEVAELLKNVADQNKDKATRGKAITTFMKVVENVGPLTGDAAKDEALLKDYQAFRKVTLEGTKGKDLFLGAKMPELTSKTLDDKEVKLSDYKGKVVVVDIWATWCPPCVAMIPHSTKLVERMKGKPFALVSVSFDDKKETVTQFIEKTPMPWDQWFNGKSGMIGKELNVTFFPTIYVVDAKGVIRFKGVRSEKMDKAVELLVKECEDDKKAKTE